MPNNRTKTRAPRPEPPARAIKILLLCALLLTLPWSHLIAATNVSGVIATDTTWTRANSPYIVTGNITVQGADGPDGVTTLTIEPGVQVRGQRFRINIGGSSGHPGALIARGSHDAPIVFTSNQATQAPGDWFGITFNPTSAAYSAMEHCTVEFAGYGGTAAIHIQNASPSIADTTIGRNSAKTA